MPSPEEQTGKSWRLKSPLQNQECKQRSPLDGLGGGFVHGGEVRYQLQQACNFHNGKALPGKRGKREFLFLIAAVHEELNEGTHASRIDKADATHIQHEALRGVRPHLLEEGGHGLKDQLSLELGYGRDAVAAGLRFNGQGCGLHKHGRLAQEVFQLCEMGFTVR